MASATFPVAQGGNGLSYSADGSAAQDMLVHRNGPMMARSISWNMWATTRV